MQWMILFKIVLPTVQKYLAQYAADYLEARKERRLLLAELAERPADCPPCPPCPAPASPAGNSRKIWYGASGVLLGGALGLIGYLLWRPAKPGS
ncbi:MAG: hypothetical protein Kow0031_07620 [Anaerolineae bacterium]